VLPFGAGCTLDSTEAVELARGFNALGDPVRLRLLSMLAAAPAGEICVCDFIAPIGKTQGTISHHLKILGQAGLVHSDRRGKWVWYSLDRERLAGLRAAIDASSKPLPGPHGAQGQVRLPK
jgi:ArsR family transcriptional regulator